MHPVTLPVSQNVLMNHISERSFRSMCSKCLPPASYMFWDGRVTG